jgi:hypothetical protein
MSRLDLPLPARLAADLVGPHPLPPPRMVDLRLVLAVSTGLYGLCLMLAPQLLNDADSHWHLFFGRSILAGQGFPTTDAYSHTFTGQPWIAKEWLSQVLMALAERMGGWTGVVVLASACAALSFAILTHEALRRLDWRPALVLMGAAISLSLPHMLARPHLIALPALVLWTAGLFRATEEARRPSLLLLPVMVLWANLHGSFLLGIALCGPLGLEAVLRAEARDRLKVLIGWGLFGLAAMAAACIHPYGPDSILAAFRVLGLGEARGLITEWRAQDFATLSGFEIVLLGGIALTLVTGFRLPWLRLLLLLALLHLALAHVRHQTVFAVLGVLILAPAIARARGPRDEVTGALRPIVAGALALVVVATAGLGLSGLARPRAAVIPAEALAAARAANVSGPVLNAYDFGGWLITQGVPTAIDGRTELFGGAFLAEHSRALDLKDPAALIGLLERHHIGWTLLQTGTPAIALLDRLPGWRRVHADAVAVVHQRMR